MVIQSTPVINNVKISIQSKVKIILNHKADEHTKLHGNYAVIRLNFVYIVYFSGWVNITGIRGKTLIPEAVKELLMFTNLTHCDIHDITIDNISAAGSFGKHLTIRFIKKSLELIKCQTVFDYKPGKFSGASIKFGKRNGTINLFTSGKYTIVGANTEERVLEVFRITANALFQESNENI